PPLRHVATHAILRCAMRLRVALHADGRNVRCFAMRIVATEAGELAAALAEAAALLEAVRGVVDLEAVGAGDLRIDDVDRHEVVAQRLTGTIRVDVAAEAADAGDGH